MEGSHMENPQINELGGTQKACDNQHDFKRESTKACSGSSTSASKPGNGCTTESAPTTGTAVIVYDVEHLATFSTTATKPTDESHEGGSQPSSKHNNNDASISKQVADAEATQNGSSLGPTTPRVALRKLFELEKLSGIWTQHMQIELRGNLMLIVDCETNCVVEKFHRHCVSQPEAFNHYNHIYNNIVVFIIKQLEQLSGLASDQEEAHYEECSDDNESAKSELHIFQCVSHLAQQLVDDIVRWKSGASGGPAMQSSSNQPAIGSGSSLVMSSSSSSGVSSTSAHLAAPSDENNKREESSKCSSSTDPASSPVEAIKPASDSTDTSKPVITVASKSLPADTVPIVNVNVKETVQVFNQIAALRGKSTLISPTSQLQQPMTATTPSTSRLSSVDHGSPSSSKLAGEPIRQNNASTINNSSPSSSSSTSRPYKKRTIRATLAPADGEPHLPASGRQHPCGSTSSSDQQKPVHSVANDSKPVRHLTVAHGSQRNENVEQHSSTRAGVVEGQSNHPRGLSKQKPATPPQDTSACYAIHLQQQNQAPLEQVTSNESYVSVLNHCFDDIELFIIRLQHAMTALQGLHHHHHAPALDGATPSRKQLSKRSGSVQLNGAAQLEALAPVCDLLNPNGVATPIGPTEDDFYEIFSKFKLAFNLLAKLKGCIHEPNAPELVHFLFTPLTIIVEAAQNAKPPIDPTAVGIPYLNQDALDLLSNCCTSKESDMWNSLGPNWTKTIDVALLKASRLPSSFQPIFSDGWAPVIGELELIGLVMPGKKKQLTKSEGSGQLQTGAGRGRSGHYPEPEEFVSHQSTAQFYNMANEMSSQQHDKHAGRKKSGKLVPGSSSRARSSSKTSQMYSSLQDGPIHPSASDLHQHRPLREQSSHSRAHSKPNWRQPPRQSARDSSDRQLNYQPEYPQDLVEGDIGEEINHQVNSDVYSEYQCHPITIRGDPYADPSSIPRYRRSSGREPSWNRYDRLKMPLNSSYPPSDCPTETQLEATLIELDTAQTEWFYELQDRGAMIVKVLFSREANNEKELTVRRGELLEVLDDSRKWWRARNIELHSGHVPHTIVAVLQDFRAPQDELVEDSFPSSNELHRNPVIDEKSHYGHHQRHFKSSGEPPLAQPNHHLPSIRDTRSHKSESTGSRPPVMFRYF